MQPVGGLFISEKAATRCSWLLILSSACGIITANQALMETSTSTPTHQRTRE